jgi:hypothetical protein
MTERKDFVCQQNLDSNTNINECGSKSSIIIRGNGLWITESCQYLARSRILWPNFIQGASIYVPAILVSEHAGQGGT